MKRSLAAPIVLLLLASAAPAVARQISPAWDEPVNGLRMSISRFQKEPGLSKDVRIRVELQNQGESDLIIKLGIMLANGKKQYASDIYLILTDPQGTTHRLKVRGPDYFAGRVDPFVLLLPAGASFSIPVDLSNCWPDGPGGLDPKKLEAGVYFLEAQLTWAEVPKADRNPDWMGIALAPYWKGTVTSNRLRFEISVH